jgi:hypothetical protein
VTKQDLQNGDFVCDEVQIITRAQSEALKAAGIKQNVPTLLIEDAPEDEAAFISSIATGKRYPGQNRLPVYAREVERDGQKFLRVVSFRVY